MKTAEDRLAAAFNILSKGGIDKVDLYSELAKTEALVNYINSQPQPIQTPAQPEQVMPQTPNEIPISTQ
jgi:DNA transposition AAA+ family ATPase